MTQLLNYKLLALFGLEMISLSFGLLPYTLKNCLSKEGKSPKTRIFISAVVCFSGGTLLGVTFLHLMPEMRERLDREYEDVPMSDILTCGGFCFVYLCDELMHIIVEKCMARHNTSRRSRLAATATTASQQYEESHPIELFSLDAHDSRHMRRRHSAIHDLQLHDGPVHLPREETEVELKSTDLTRSAEDAETPPPLASSDHNTPRGLGFSNIVTIIVLSFHDVFEGFVIGVENSRRAVMFMFLSVACHKCAISFCIGLDLALGGTSLMVAVIYMFTYSTISPTGVVFGIILVAVNSDSTSMWLDEVVVVLQGLASGTLIYVVFFEILQREGSTTHARGMLNVVFVVIGFSVSLALKITLGHTNGSHQSKENSTKKI